jgi:hypothetical protein
MHFVIKLLLVLCWELSIVCCNCDVHDVYGVGCASISRRLVVIKLTGLLLLSLLLILLMTVGI